MNLKNIVQQYDRLQLLDDYIKYKYEPHFKKKLLGEISNIIHNNNLHNENDETINKDEEEIKENKENEKSVIINNEEESFNLNPEKEKKIDLSDDEMITTFEAINNPNLNKNLVKNMHETKRKMNLRSIKMLNNNVIQFEHPANFTIFDKKKTNNKNLNSIEENKTENKRFIHPCQENYLKEIENEKHQRRSIKSSIKKANKNLLYCVNNFPNIHLDKNQNKKIKVEFKDEYKFYDNNDRITAIKNFSKKNFLNQKFKKNKNLMSPKKEEETVKIKEIERDGFDPKGTYYIFKPFIPNLRGKLAHSNLKKRKRPFRLIYSATPKNSYEHYLEKYGNDESNVNGYNDRTYKFGYGTSNGFRLRKIDFFVDGNKFY